MITDSMGFFMASPNNFCFWPKFGRKVCIEEDRLMEDAQDLNEGLRLKPLLILSWVSGCIN